jgi:dienelactone hydrolase
MADATGGTKRAAPRRTTPLTAHATNEHASRASLGFTVAGVVLVLAALVLLLRLGAQERGGPAHGEVSIGDGIPATLYLPEDAEDDGDLPTPPPEGERPPVVVMAHGYSADRASMSGLARSLAEGGYAVLSFDFRGHGSNTHRFQGDLRDDFAAAVDWAQTSPYVDGDELAVLGHSMGAGAALDFASLDARPKAVVPVSGGWVLNDAVVPANTLFLVASGDPGRIHDRQEELADDLEAVGGTVEREEVGGTDHITVLRNDDTVAAITGFLDPILGVDRADGERPGIVDPRYGTALLYLIVALALVAMLGTVVGGLAPAGAQEDPPGPVWAGFALLVGALFLTMPLLAVGGWDPLPLGAGQPIVVHLALAAALLWGVRALARRDQVPEPVGTWLRGDRPWLSLPASGWVGLAAAGAIVTLLIPLSPVFHRLVPTPQRALYWVVMAGLALPFFAAFHALVRRRSGWWAVGIGVLGRVVLLLVLVVGLALEVLPTVISLVIPLLVLQYVLLELFAAGCWARSRNTTVVAVVDAVIVGWMAVMLTPVG